MGIAQYDPFAQLRHQLFHQHFVQPLDRGEPIRASAETWSPLVDIFEDEEGINLKVELPEVNAGDVDIQLEGNTLTLRGERKLENAEKRQDYHRIERNHGTFSRSFTLPSTVEMGNVTAQTRDGILRIFLPKKAETKSRQIKVTVGSGRDAVVKQ
jgi:HSP20 family protein